MALNVDHRCPLTKMAWKRRVRWIVSWHRWRQNCLKGLIIALLMVENQDLTIRLGSLAEGRVVLLVLKHKMTPASFSRTQRVVKYLLMTSLRRLWFGNRKTYHPRLPKTACTKTPFRCHNSMLCWMILHLLIKALLSRACWAKVKSHKMASWLWWGLHLGTLPVLQPNRMRDPLKTIQRVRLRSSS